MRTTVDIDDELLRRAQALSEISGKTAVIHAGLEALVAREARARLARLGGTEKRTKAAPRRRDRASR